MHRLGYQWNGNLCWYRIQTVWLAGRPCTCLYGCRLDVYWSPCSWFYYDFMDVFVDRSDFQYCSMDTDSAYMALSATSLEEVIKPEMQQRFRMEKKNWFPLFPVGMCRLGYQWNGNLCWYRIRTSSTTEHPCTFLWWCRLDVYWSPVYL
jgi:hypothetical protein